MNEHINNDGTTSHLALLHPSKNLFHCFYYFIHFAFSSIRIHFYICLRGYIIINNAKLASTWARFRLSASSGTSQFFSTDYICTHMLNEYNLDIHFGCITTDRVLLLDVSYRNISYISQPID